MPYSTKKYREFCRKKLNFKLNKDGKILYTENNHQSIIYEIVKSYNKYMHEQNKIISLCFDYLTTLDNIFLYNLSKGNIDDLEYKESNEFLDKKYLRYI